MAPRTTKPAAKKAAAKPPMPEHVEVFYNEYTLDFGFHHWLPDKLNGTSNGFTSRSEAAEFAGVQLPGVPIEFSCRG